MTNPAISLQTATEAHATAIRRLVTTSGINPTGLDWQRFVVALDSEGQLVGCGQIKPHHDGSHELASVAVEPTWRGQGIASALIEHLLNQHSGDLYLMCQSSLRLLYEKFDFLTIEEAQMPTYFRRISKLAGVLQAVRERGESLLIMRRTASG